MHGCGTQVFKPAEDTPLSALAFAEILQEAGLPDGAFTVVLGTGSVGAQLCQHPDIAKVPLGDRGVGSKGGKGGGGWPGSHNLKRSRACRSPSPDPCRPGGRSTGPARTASSEYGTGPAGIGTVLAAEQRPGGVHRSPLSSGESRLCWCLRMPIWRQQRMPPFWPTSSPMARCVSPSRQHTRQRPPPDPAWGGGTRIGVLERHAGAGARASVQASPGKDSAAHKQAAAWRPPGLAGPHRVGRQARGRCCAYQRQQAHACGCVARPTSVA
jgi:hypothetical protein